MDSDADWKNVAVVGGQDQGADRKVVTVALAAGPAMTAGSYGWMQRIFPPRIRSPRRPEKWMRTEILNIRTPKHTYTDAEYEALLRVRGLEKLAEKIKKLEVTANAGQDLMYYGEDYFSGTSSR